MPALNNYDRKPAGKNKPGEPGLFLPAPNQPWLLLLLLLLMP